MLSVQSFERSSSVDHDINHRAIGPPADHAQSRGHWFKTLIMHIHGDAKGFMETASPLSTSKIVDGTEYDEFTGLAYRDSFRDRAESRV